MYNIPINKNLGDRKMNLTFEKISSYSRGILYKQLVDGYSMDNRWRAHCEMEWIEYDNFFFDNIDIVDKYGFITVLDGEPIGHISWNPRNIPEYVEIGHNCIISKYKGYGYGKIQLQEAIERIQKYSGLKKIIVSSNSNLVAPYNYESVGFKLCERRGCESKTSFTGDYLYYEMIL